MSRLAKLNEEEDYFITEYRKELKAKSKTANIKYDGDSKSNYNYKRKRGGKTKSKGQQESNAGLNSLEITIKNRLFTRALFDTDNEVDLLKI